MPGPDGLVVAHYLLSVFLDVVQGQTDLGDVEFIPASQFFRRGPRLRLGEDIVNGDARTGDLRTATTINDGRFHERFPLQAIEYRAFYLRRSAGHNRPSWQT